MAEINIKTLNALAKEDPTKMIADAEALYEEKVRAVSERITGDSDIKIVLIAGPSGSGKTTTANLVADAIRSRGEDALVVSLDDFYRDQDDPEYPRLLGGGLDYECPESLNLSDLSTVLSKIVRDEEFEIPKYDFKLTRRVRTTKHQPIGHGCVIIEGLHALNPKISDALPRERILKIFVSVSTNINGDEERLLSGRKLRFIRRLVRDNIYRGAELSRTLSMWHGVLMAEDVYLYPYKGCADMTFDTFHSFELSVMKGFAEALIPRSHAERDMYLGAVLKGLNAAVPIDHTLIPMTSLIREFIPGGIYENLY